MVKLPTKTERNELNIDTWERAILYSAMLLYAGVRDPNSDLGFNDAVTITVPNNNTANFDITISATLQIDRSFSLELGGNLVESVLKYNFSEPEILPECGASNFNTFIQLPESEPSFITGSTERYFTWLCHRVKANLIENNNGEANRISTQFFLDNPSFPQLRIQVRLPVDNLCYLRNDSLLCCLIPIVNNAVVLGNLGEAPEQPDSETSQLLNNTAILNNEFILENSDSSGGGSTSTVFDNTLTLNNNTIMENN